LILDLEFRQHLGSLKHVINIIMWIRDTECYTKLDEKSIVVTHLTLVTTNARDPLR
jgi:hypothetical protein